MRRLESTNLLFDGCPKQWKNASIDSPPVLYINELSGKSQIIHVGSFARIWQGFLLPIVHDPKLGALDKLPRFFATLDHHKRAHKHLVLAYLRAWYADENAIVRHKLYIACVKRLTPLLEEIIRQGTREGVFTTPYPDQAARMIISLLEDLAYATVELLLSEERSPDDLPRLERIVEACADALERVLGAPVG